MYRRTCLLLAGAMIVLLPGSILRAQDSEPSSEGEFIRSMGIPSRYEFSLSPMFVIGREDDETGYGGQLSGSLYRHILSPLYGIGVTGEGYVEDVESKDVDGGLRLLGGVKMLFLDAGVDYSFRDESADFILSAAFPLKRGGLFGRGGSLRIDWLPSRDNSFNIGFSIPLGQPYKGKTRTKHARVRLPAALGEKPQSPGRVMSPELRTTMDQLRHAASWINRYTTPFIDQKELDDVQGTAGFVRELRVGKAHLNLKDDLYPEGHTFESEILMYHRKLLQAFEQCVSNGEPPSAQDRNEAGRIADKTREIVLEEVIMPYNRLLGQSKKNDSLLGYAAKAATRFTAWLDSSTRLSPDQRAAVQSVFVRLMDIIEEERENRKEAWKESELVWIPLQYGLQPHEYDTRAEMRTILEKAVEKRFSNANQVYYVINEQFQPEVAKMIFQAEDYHVLWIHDYRGVNAAGKPDSVSFRQTVDVYFAALTKKVREYDNTGTLPAYIILIDQYFFEANGRFWLELLQDPLNYKLRLPSEYHEWNERIEAAQNKLRTAVAESKLLQEQAGKYGRKWLKNKIKVHVNITNPSDWSFRSQHLIPYIPFVPDNLMRDHRKISFYDITERDPGKGEALYSGMGIGEQYVGKTWEDRALLARGPVLLSLKNEARRVLLQQGFKEQDIPAPLRKQSLPSNYDDMVESLRKQGWTTSAMDVHNQTGFRPKLLNTLKTTLYTLMPRGSIIMVPDGYWNTPFWGGMLAGAALRGCRVLILAPSPENSTFSDAYPLLSRSQELFSRLVVIQKELKNELDAVGGMLKTGVYVQESDLGAIGAANEFFEGIRNAPFLKEVFPFQPEVYAALESERQRLKSEGYQPRYYSEDAEERKPKLHLKINVLVSGNVQGLLAAPGWDEIFRAYIRYRAKFTTREEGEADVRDIPVELREAADRILETFRNSLPEEEQKNAMAFLLIGSQNHNYRSFIMDAEVACVVTGVDSLEALVDFFFLAGTSIWVEDLETLEKVLPAQKGFSHWVGRFMRKAM